jgi:hypothetical protein
MSWPKHPVIYEINTWVWLGELSRRFGKPIGLGSVPDAVWDEIGELHPDAVWLMGVWERSPVGLEIAQAHEGLQAEFRRALPDYAPRDNVGSPYCIRRYTADPHLGGAKGLAAARAALAKRHIRLVLDFVPNHVAPDHPWVAAHPEFFLRGTADDLAHNPYDYHESDGFVFACGRDPYFPPWTDVLQLNAFDAGLRKEAARTLGDIAAQCDGVRCDMAMLLITRVFEGSWGARAGEPPATEYWREVIGEVGSRHPEFLFIAEAYWDLEWELQQLGFHYCYDKRLYDRLEHDAAENIRLHLLADLPYQERLLRFIENHDEPRAARIFPGGQGYAAAVTVATLPGAKLFHEGQIEGRRVKVPVQLVRRPFEAADADLAAFYRKLLHAIDTPAIREGEWRLCERSGWPDNPSHMNLVAWCWRKENDRRLVVVNLSGARSQGRVWIPWGDLVGFRWCLTDVMTGVVYDRDGGEMTDPGLYVDLESWGFHFFDVSPGG